MDSQLLKKYAGLIVRTGVNVQPGQYVVISAETDQRELAAYVKEAAYLAGAKYVDIEWNDPECSLLDYKYATEKELSKVYSYVEKKWKWKTKKLPCMIYIDSDDPDAFKDADIEKMGNVRAGRMKVIKKYRDRMDNKYQWVIAAAAGKKWASKVFPGLDPEEAVEKLWDMIFHCVRMGDGTRESAYSSDPVENWNKHCKTILERCEWLNSLGLKSLHYSSSNGTDFTVGLIEDAVFAGGGEMSLQGIYYIPNMPTEEIFTSPMKGKAEGRLVSTKPLSWQGQLIEDFYIDFKDGKASSVYARKGQETLEKMISMDKTAGYLGEVALVPKESPVGKCGVLFYDTLFDENASCHVALGRGFSSLLKGFENMTPEEIEKAGINDSAIHVDFMIGADDLSIVGTAKDGKKIRIFENGTWADQARGEADG